MPPLPAGSWLGGLRAADPGRRAGSRSSSARRRGCARARGSRPTPRRARGRGPARGRPRCRRRVSPEALERQEDPVPVGARDARAAVDDPDLHLAAVLARRHDGRLAGRAVPQRVRERGSPGPARAAPGRRWTAATPRRRRSPRRPGAAGPRSSSARGSTSASVDGCGVIASAPACSRLMSSRFSTRRPRRSSEELRVARAASSGRRRRARRRALRRVVDRGLRRRERGAQVVADGVEQRGAQPVDLGERARPRRPGLGEPLLASARRRPAPRTPRRAGGRRRRAAGR